MLIAKIFKLSLRHLLSLIPKPDYVLRSHASANDRCCFRERDGKIKYHSFDKSRIDYSKEFSGINVYANFLKRVQKYIKET